MDIYLDANATTAVLPKALSAAVEVMAENFGNPSSAHSAGLRSRDLLETVRSRARRVLCAPSGSLLFLSGATEGIQTAVVSALVAVRAQQAVGERPLLLYGATEHKAVPEALRHWNSLLGLDAQILAIPVNNQGRHDLRWLRKHAQAAGLVCTMAANNETGVISDMDGIADALRPSAALWLVDGVQALGKLQLRLNDYRIDYAAFSGHKLCAPKGIGMLYVREGAPFTPLLAGGGQEQSQRSGTENMPGVAALGVVLDELESGLFPDSAALHGYRDQLVRALHDAFPGLVINAPLNLSLPTTLNFSVPGFSSRLILDLFDSVGIHASGGSACSSASSQPSQVLEAMGHPPWRASSAVRLSFGRLTSLDFIAEACARIRRCGDALRNDCLMPGASPSFHGVLPLPDGVSRFVSDGNCTYLIADTESRRVVVIDLFSALSEQLAKRIFGLNYEVVAVLSTSGRREHAFSLEDLPLPSVAVDGVDTWGWPLNTDTLSLGRRRLNRLPIPGFGSDSRAYLLQQEEQQFVFVGRVLPASVATTQDGGLAREQMDLALRHVSCAGQICTLLLPGTDPDGRWAYALNAGSSKKGLPLDRFHPESPESDQSVASDNGLTQPSASTALASLDMSIETLSTLLKTDQEVILVDVREPHEHFLSPVLQTPGDCRLENVPMTAFLNAVPRWMRLPRTSYIVFLCRTGSRSNQATQVLRRLGHSQAFSIAGGLALMPSYLLKPKGDTRA